MAKKSPDSRSLGLPELARLGLLPWDLFGSQQQVSRGHLLPKIGDQSVGGADDIAGSRRKGVVLDSLPLIGIHVTGILVG